MSEQEKPLVWIGSSKKDLMTLPTSVRKFFGHALDFAQHGDRHDAAKVLKGFGGAGILEVVEDDAGGTYRAVYAVKFEEAVFVLHCFQKEEQERDRHAEGGHGDHPHTAEGGRGNRKGDETWQSVSLKASRSKRARATSLPTWAFPMPKSSRSSPAW